MRVLAKLEAAAAWCIEAAAAPLLVIAAALMHVATWHYAVGKWLRNGWVRRQNRRRRRG